MNSATGSVLEALKCLSSSTAQATKNQALQYLEEFQKSKDAWSACLDILSKSGAQDSLELQVFAAQTLRNKVTYDLSQLGNDVSALKESVLELIAKHFQKVIVTQLCVALARLSIQYLEWKNPVGEIITSLNAYPSKLLEFLRILPEESLDMKSTPLTEDEFRSRTHELIGDIADDVFNLLLSAVSTLHAGQSDVSVTQVLNCLNSWSFELPIDKVVRLDPLMGLLFSALEYAPEENVDSFDAAVDCLCTILRETRDSADENVVMALYQQLMTLQSKLLSFDEGFDPDEHYELLEGLTRLFVQAGEAWCVFIARNPDVFKPLAHVLLLLTCKNTDLDVVKYTFPFWFNFKQMLVLPRFRDQKLAYQDIFSHLIDGIIAHLQYPETEFSSKEEEDKFKEFRYDMGGVLKDCTAILGSSRALRQPFDKINNALNTPEIASQWQRLEAPLFSLRTMAQEVSTNENDILPQLFKLLCSLPEHPRVRYATTLVFGRYTEWTSKHPEFLQLELNYIFNGFNYADGNIDILTASSHSLMYFCQDCSSLLSSHVEELIDFYWKIEPMVDNESLFEVCQGLSAVINKADEAHVAGLLNLFIDLQLKRLTDSVALWKKNKNAKRLINELADRIDLIYAVFEELRPREEFPGEKAEPLLPVITKIWENILDVLVQQGGAADAHIAEISMKWVRKVVFNFHVFITPLLASIANFLVDGYSSSGYGSYLWCSGAIISVFGDEDSFPIDPSVKSAVWQFICSQCVTFMGNFNMLNKTTLDDYYESIQDFFMMMTDVVMFFPDRLLTSETLLGPSLAIGLECVNQIQNYDAYITVVRFLDDVISWGFETPPVSIVMVEVVPLEWRQHILSELVQSKGQLLTTNIILGLVSNFNSDAHPDAIGCLVRCLKLVSQSTGDNTLCMSWLASAMQNMPNVTEQESSNLLETANNALQQRDMRKLRNGIKDFTAWYLRKNVSPRMYK
ncbi:LAMI_0D10946g1_1 [Lachancea mirantina]|uniref:LAMI_0D10946g1_1 n=1 Tax=Lachancea mirantina TaxID=1230905 RepID=A0A1G4JEK3_9SACH|nr:LAMI_0D10946g1_1 [Lachancea mirantina]